MLLCVGGVLDETALAKARAVLEARRWVDGKLTAGWLAKGVKDNRQADPADRALAELRTELAERVTAHPLVRLAARPKALSSLLLSRYEPGMAYGRHVDDALMAGARADISFTLFISPAEAYAGGELVIESSAGEQSYKLPAGGLVLYPSTTLHRVAPVTEGVRLVAAGWLRSYVRDPAAREILFDLDTARRTLFERHGRGEEVDLLSKSVANLLRMWAED